MNLRLNRKGKLDEVNKFLLKIAADIMTEDFTADELDFYILSIINRSISLNKAFMLLMKNENSLTAISIVRMQLDNALRLNAVKIANNREEFLNHFFEGKAINKYKEDRDRFTDNYLANQLNNEVPGALELYNYLCDFVHFSDKYFSTTTTTPLNKDALFRVVVGNSAVLNNEQQSEFYERMTSISNTIIRISTELNVKNTL